jgi:thiol-disulfide isomerase/thioredoxin
VAFIVVKTNKSSSGSTASPTISGAPTGTNLTSILKTITTVPTSATDAVGSGGSAVSKPTSISSSSLTSGGKPEMLYIGAEYCPYCAAERWPMIVALSRFGTFTGIQPMKSSSSDVYPNTSTWTFAHATYTSKYLTFTPVEWYTNIPASGGGYTVLDTPTAAQQDLINKYGGGGFPFVDFAGKYVISGESYSPQVLAGLSWNQISSDLTSSSSPVAQAIGGTANYMTAALCKLTGNLPATACTSTVQSLEGSL